MNRLKITLGLCAVMMLAACANRKAGIMLAGVQQEFDVYQRNANTKIEEAYDAMLALELDRVKDNMEEQFRLRALPPEESARRALDAVMDKIEAHESWMDKWHETDESAAKIGVGLDAAIKYNGAGVTAEDTIPTIDSASAIIAEYITQQKALKTAQAVAKAEARAKAEAAAAEAKKLKETPINANPNP